MKRFLRTVGLAVAVLWLWHGAPGFAAEPRIALVIGNSAYENAPLANPVNDARLIAETLRDLGFDVIERINADRKTIQLATFELQDRLLEAGKDAVGLFYYAGHGVQVGGQNYLIPLNSEIEKEREVAVEAVSAGFVLKQMEFAGNRMNFVILDACRNNPLTRSFRSAARGLARMQAPTGSLVAYSTGPGEVAVDGSGDNSPYVLALSEAMRTPGLPAELMFKRVRESVLEATNDEQTPWEESSLKGANFYFNVNVSVTVEAPETPAPSATDPEATERLFWETIKDSTDPASFEVYLAEYPNGKFAALAQLRIKQLEEARTAALAPPPEPGFGIDAMDATFVVLEPSNVRAEPTIASDRMNKIGEGFERDDVVTVTGKVRDKNWYRIDYQGQTAYILGSLIEEVDPGELTAWAKVADTSEHSEVEAFLEDYPKGHFAERAKSLLAALAPPPEPDTGSAVQPAVGVYSETYQPGDTFKDCDECPEMVVVPAGEFMMGDLDGGGENDEKPVHGATIPRPFAVGIYEVTRGEFARFVSEAGYDAGAECWIYDGSNWATGIGRNWRDPAFRQTDRDPVVCMNWKDAQAYVSWLSRATGNTYRLLSEAEWEYSARAGTRTRYWYGDDNDARQLCSHGNGASRETAFSWKNGACEDGYALTAPVGAFHANKFGLHDMHGNVWEWVEDCWHENYTGAPADGRTWTSGGDCGRRVIRGGSWGLDQWDLRSASRDGYDDEDRDADVGFRVAMTLP